MKFRDVYMWLQHNFTRGHKSVTYKFNISPQERITWDESETAVRAQPRRLCMKHIK